ncbi:AAA domain-containing protein [Flavihumibacter solisilvae]|uniref:DNA helicase n=1 Tax=Flavihumibacter solisilvae TaxID=1349421 RepID=A0A0C1LFI6_9BACT|nr:AAA domain-containing protein [Flavihumibacter solisilvae]KIC94098.1 DNA helicase [Flavihumibacter solisilvae]
MAYFKRLLDLLDTELQEDRQTYRELIERSSVQERKENGLTWYPIAIRDTELGRGDYLIVEVERTTNTDIIHQLRFGASAALFSQHDPQNDRIEGIISHQSENRLKLTLRTDELPDWSDNGKLGIDLLFDENSYDEMRGALRQASAQMDKGQEGKLVRILTGEDRPSFQQGWKPLPFPSLNESQQHAVNMILSSNELGIVHGPPGTGKTTTLVQAIKALYQQDESPVLVVAPSNTAVDLLSEKLDAQGLNVVRVGNPARVSEHLMELTIDSRMSAHSSMKEVKKLKKQASEYRNLAHRYKRNFGKAERDQRKALFDEARKILKDVESTEQYILDDILRKAQVITATLVGANHYTVRNLRYKTVVLDEAAQALEPACWIPILKAQRVIMAGDHQQLAPTIKSDEAAKAGLAHTLFEKCVAMYPEAVTMLEEQYRMNNEIMGYSSEVFYDGKLKAHASVATHRLLAGDKPLVFIDTAGCGYEEKTLGTSTSNPEEAALVMRHAELLLTEIISANGSSELPSVGIISPYKQQVETLKDQWIHTPMAKSYGGPVSVNTIDSFQGQERDVIYISMTRSNPDSRIGFLSEIRRMNVAMTRARKKLVVIGDSATLSQSPFYAGFIKYAEDNDAYQSAWEFM